MKHNLVKPLILALCLMMAVSSCAPSKYHADNRNKKQEADFTTEDFETPTIEQDLVSTTRHYEEWNEEKALKYEAPVQVIKNGERKVFVGYSRLKNIKSVYNRKNLELEVYGTAEVLNADKKSVKTSKDFHLKGKYQIKTGKISLKPAAENIVAGDNEGLQVRAEVICVQNDDGKYNCDKAIIDVFIKDGENFYTEQLEATSLDKPSIVGREEKKSVETPTNETPAVETPVTSATSQTDPQIDDEAINEVVADDVGNQAEGEDEALDGRYVGQAETVELDKLFSEEKPETEKPEETEVETIINEVAGRLILRDQVAGNGSPDNGRLRNASFLKTHIDSYNLVDHVIIANSSTKNYYGTQEMMNILEAIGKKMQTIQNNKIYVSRISAKNGGPLPPSVSHQIGMDVDLGYPTLSGKTAFPRVASQGILRRSDYSTAKTLEIFKFLMTQQVTPIDRIFADQSIINNLCSAARSVRQLTDQDRYALMKLFNNIQHVSGHGDHFHLRLRCTPNQPACRLKDYKKMNNCSL